MELDTRLYEVGEYLEQEDNRNIILRNPQGKRFWRLPSVPANIIWSTIPSSSKFPQRGLRMYCAWLIVTPVSLTASLMCWVPNPEAVHEYDLLAILVGNATNQGIYGMAQISDRTYDQLSTIQANYLRLETLNAANDNINNATAKLPIFRYYNIQKM